MFPGQLEALQERVDEIRLEEKRKGTRRAFFGFTLGGLCGVAGATLIGGRTVATAAPRPEVVSDPKLDWARGLAKGSTEALIDNWSGAAEHGRVLS